MSFLHTVRAYVENSGGSCRHRRVACRGLRVEGNKCPIESRVVDGEGTVMETPAPCFETEKRNSTIRLPGSPRVQHHVDFPGQKWPWRTQPSASSISSVCTLVVDLAFHSEHQQTYRRPTRRGRCCPSPTPSPDSSLSTSPLEQLLAFDTVLQRHGVLFRACKLLFSCVAIAGCLANYGNVTFVCDHTLPARLLPAHAFPERARSRCGPSAKAAA